jgi:hypothetical protein
MDWKTIMKDTKLKNTLLKSHRATQSASEPLNEQVAGSWYKSLKIQPIEYCMANKLNACQVKVIKYTTRCLLKNKDKKGRKQDIDKAIHCLEMLKEFIDKDVV